MCDIGSNFYWENVHGSGSLLRRRRVNDSSMRTRGEKTSPTLPEQIQMLSAVHTTSCFLKTTSCATYADLRQLSLQGSLFDNIC